MAAFSGFVQKSHAEDQWLRGDIVELQALDKITARISTLTAVVGEPFRFGSLEILISACTYRPPTMAPEHAALFQVKILIIMARFLKAHFSRAGCLPLVLRSMRSNILFMMFQFSPAKNLEPFDPSRHLAAFLHRPPRLWPIFL